MQDTNASVSRFGIIYNAPHSADQPFSFESHIDERSGDIRRRGNLFHILRAARYHMYVKVMKSFLQEWVPGQIDNSSPRIVHLTRYQEPEIETSYRAVLRAFVR